MEIGFHILGAMACAIGIAFLFMYAFKHFSEAELWRRGWALVIIGLVLCLLSAGIGGGVMMRGGYRTGSTMMRWNNPSQFFDDEIAPNGVASSAATSSSSKK